jgi:hypothetical protein
MVGFVYIHCRFGVRRDYGLAREAQNLGHSAFDLL